MNDPRKRFLSFVARLLRPAPPAPPVLVTAADRTATAILFAIFFTMTAFVGLSLYIGFNFVSPRLGAESGPRECREDLAGQCGEGEVCSDGQCVPDPQAVDCAENEPCGACTCIYPMTCGDDQICRVQPPSTHTCSPKAAEFVREMLAYQVQCVSNAGGMELSSCPTTNVKDFLLSHEKFDALLQEFPHSLVFLFPDGRPELGDPDAPGSSGWPDAPTRQFYSAAIQGEREALAKARHIVLVGRASRGNTALSFAYAQSRVRFARSALLDTLTGTPTERSEMSKKFIEFALGAERPLSLEFFLLHQQSVAAWNDATRRDMSRVIEDMRANQTPARSKRKSIEEAINRSVAIFAIPPECADGGK